MTDLRRTVERFWATAAAREWDAFAETLAEDVVYTLPQTRERISGRERYVRFNREYPGTGGCASSALSPSRGRS